ncbi:hypothetical protein B0I00_1619 [Novosphingobium kunmingense]|uniref:Uncharacterized protein n=1 Tax=Novosphingobium kunmingense TaxID=1211806 RepID=A0A2N0HKA7_9SPHN|nr:hypothetical protein B0I00_1619 [Novosphingobium kunmingense]
MTARYKSRPDYLGFFLPLGAMATMIWYLVS